MKIRKREGSVSTYDESKVRLAVMHAGAGADEAASLAAEVTRRARPPLDVTKIGDITEEVMLKAGLHDQCRRYIEYRAKRRMERQERAVITGGVDEALKHIRPGTLKMLRDADHDIHKAIARIEPECGKLILSGRFIPDDLLVMEGKPAGPYRLVMPHGRDDQLAVMRHAGRYAVYVDWNRTQQSFRDAFRAVCAHTGCLVREGRFGGMLDMSRIPITELAETARQAADVLSAWEGASGPGVIIPPGMDHKKIHDVLYRELPDLEPTGIYGKRDAVWDGTPYRGGCPACGREVVRTESCSSCSCGWSACST